MRRFINVFSAALVLIGSLQLHAQAPAPGAGDFALEVFDPNEDFTSSRAYSREIIGGKEYVAASVANGLDLVEQVPAFYEDEELVVLDSARFPPEFGFGKAVGFGWLGDDKSSGTALVYGNWQNSAGYGTTWLYDVENDRMFNDIRPNNVEGSTGLLSFYPGLMDGSKLYGMTRLFTESGFENRVFEVTYDSQSGELSSRDVTVDNGIPPENSGNTVWGLNSNGDVLITSEFPDFVPYILHADGTNERLNPPADAGYIGALLTGFNSGGDFAISYVYRSDVGVFSTESFLCKSELLDTEEPFVDIGSGGIDDQVRSISDDGTVVSNAAIWREGEGRTLLSELADVMCSLERTIGCVVEFKEVSQIKNGIIVGHALYRPDRDGEIQELDRGFLLQPEGRRFTGGDANGDGVVDISDVLDLLTRLFEDRGAPPGCAAASDANEDGEVDLSDAVFVLGCLFLDAAGELPLPDCSGQSGGSGARGLPCLASSCDA